MTIGVGELGLGLGLGVSLCSGGQTRRQTAVRQSAHLGLCTRVCPISGLPRLLKIPQTAPWHWCAVRLCVVRAVAWSLPHAVRAGGGGRGSYPQVTIQGVVAMTQCVCRLVRAGVCIGLRFQEVVVCSVCP